MTEEDRKRREDSALSWAVGIALVIVGFAGILIAHHVQTLLILGWAILSVAIVIIGEVGLLSALAGWVNRHGAGELDSPDLPPTANNSTAAPTARAPVHHRHFGMRRQAELLAIVILAAIMYMPVCDSAGGATAQPNPVTPARHGPEQLYPACPTPRPGNPTQLDGGGEGQGTTLHLSQALETALLAHLAGAGRAAEHDAWWPPSFFEVFLIFLCVLTVALLFKGRGKEAAPVGALGLAAVVLEHPEHFSHLDPSVFILVFCLFAFAAISLVFMCWLKLWRGDSSSTSGSGHDAASSEHQGRESPMTLAFAAFVLLWALIALGFHETSPKAPENGGGGGKDEKKVNPLPRSQAGSIGEIRPLGSIPRFAGGPHDLTKELSVSQFEQALKNEAIQPNDVLLLIGSTDCTSFRKRAKSSNEALAKARAEWLRSQIESVPKENIRIVPLEQHEGCQETPRLRAVFPVLIRASVPKE